MKAYEQNPGLIRPAIEWLDDVELADEWLEEPEAVLRKVQVQAVRAALHHYGKREIARVDLAVSARLLGLDPEVLVP